MQGNAQAELFPGMEREFGQLRPRPTYGSRLVFTVGVLAVSFGRSLQRFSGRPGARAANSYDGRCTARDSRQEIEEIKLLMSSRVM